jgi:DNA sulfur modification protein DndE
MQLTKLRLTTEASNRLRFVAGKIGLTPNLLCRIGFCFSLSEPPIPNPDDYPEEDREFNRYTLLRGLLYEEMSVRCGRFIAEPARFPA